MNVHSLNTDGPGPDTVVLPAPGSARRAAARALRDRTVARDRPPPPRLSWVVRSFVLWNWTHLRWRLANALDTLRGRGSLEAKGARLRGAIEAMGGTAVLIGQQLALRIDLMPLEWSLALQAMVDEAPPMPLDAATARIERAFGAPLSSALVGFDPEPISSTCAFCVYRARLADDGREVAIKVRREGVRQRLVSDLVAVGWIARLLEATTWWRPGFAASLERDLRELANNRLDLALQGRFQGVFRKQLRRGGPRWLAAPRTHPDLSSRAVLVRDLEAGVPLSDVLAATARGPQGVHELAVAGIDPVVVSHRLLHAAWWGAFESLFFVAGVDASQILVQPGGRLVLLDFEDCGALSTAHKRHFQEVLTRLQSDDVSGAARAMVQVLSPLPFIDVHDFSKRIETGLWRELLALRDPEARWWERTTIGLWRAAARVAREDGVPLRLETAQFMQALLGYDTFAARLHPDLRLLRQFTRYQRAADRRAARRIRDELDGLDPEDASARWVARLGRATEGADRLLTWVESSVDQLPIATLALAGKASYAAAQGVRTAGWLGALLAVCVAVQAARGAAAGEVPAGLGLVAQAVASPGFALGAAALVWLAVRRVLYRLDDKQT
jgi:ubiquinone biosynthesis protein